MPNIAVSINSSSVLPHQRGDFVSNPIAGSCETSSVLPRSTLRIVLLLAQLFAFIDRIVFYRRVGRAVLAAVTPEPEQQHDKTNSHRYRYRPWREHKADKAAGG